MVGKSSRFELERVNRGRHGPGARSYGAVRGGKEGAALNARMNSKEFAAGDWVDRLGSALRKLAIAQELYLEEYYRQNADARVAYDGWVGNRRGYELDDLRVLYAMARHGIGDQKRFAPLCEVLDPVRYILLSQSYAGASNGSDNRPRPILVGS